MSASSPPVAIAIFWLAIVGIASSTLADGSVAAPTPGAHPPSSSEDIQDLVVPATTPPQKLDLNNKNDDNNNNKNNVRPTAVGSSDIVKGSKASWWAYTHVHIVNEFSGGMVLPVHCKSKNNDMGIHVVPPGSEYQWRFRPNIFGSSLFWCHVLKGNAEIVYEAYQAHDDHLWERVYMDNTYWVAKDDGLYLRQFWKNNDVFYRAWP